MKIRVTCFACLEEAEEEAMAEGGSLAPEERGHVHETRLTSQVLNARTCPSGHSSQFFVVDPFYSLLYVNAARSLAEGDTREAVTGFYSAWENFVAYTVDNILLNEHSGEAGAFPKRLRKSEPLLGAFAALVIAKTKASPKLPDTNKAANVRNEVVHGDLIPTEDQTFTLAEEVRTCIVSCRISLPAYDEKATDRRLEQALPTDPEPLFQFTMAGEGMAARLDEDVRSLVARIRANPKLDI